MSVIDAIIIAIVEGLTEFLPVSSTGHMIIAQSLLGMESTEFVKAFTVNIQFGAILSVILLYWKRFFKVNPVKIFDENATAGLKFSGKCRLYLNRFLLKFDFYWKLFIAFIPAAVIGFLASDYIDQMLESVFVVALMLVIGGVFMLFVDKWFNKPVENQEMDWKRALKIGFAQCVAMIPGVSRSMATIVGGMTTKLTRKNAAEFSFFLAVPTMAAASGYKLLKLFTEPGGVDMLTDNLAVLLIGNVVAFVVAMLAIKFFIGFLTKYGFKAFGYYRIVVGVALLILLSLGVNLSVI
jgi:undecaprenyl-diphosphatase